MGYSPAADATNSIVTGESPGLARGTAFLTLNALISTPWGPSAERTSSRTRVAFGHFDRGRLEREPASDDLE